MPRQYVPPPTTLRRHGLRAFLTGAAPCALLLGLLLYAAHRADEAAPVTTPHQGQAPDFVGMSGDCPIFHSRSADGAETWTLACAPGASPIADRRAP